MVARWGGEEFVCLLSGLTQQQAIDLAEQMLSRIRELGIAHAGSAVADHVTVSLGLAMMDLSRHTTWQALLEQADQALYQAKHQGRDRLVVD
jgi:diguanylate cyclase (GGDEF)-like protein